jgi:hypothetical protein
MSEAFGLALPEPGQMSKLQSASQTVALKIVAGYPFSVAAGVPPAVEPGILPGGSSQGLRRHFRVQSAHSGRQDAALYGSQDGRRYSAARRSRNQTERGCVSRTDRSGRELARTPD